MFSLRLILLLALLVSQSPVVFSAFAGSSGDGDPLVTAPPPQDLPSDDGSIHIDPNG
jgi:hypothetical protein